MRNKYTEAYKTSAVKMVLEEGKMPVEVADNLGMRVGLLYKWIRQYNDPSTENRTEKLSNISKRFEVSGRHLIIS